MLARTTGLRSRPTRTRWIHLGLVAAGWLALAPAPARAQTLGFSAQRFRPAASPMNYYNTESGQTLPHLSPSVGLYVHYAHRPLQVINRFTDQRLYDEVKYQLGADLMVAFGLWNRLELGLTLPIMLTQDSDPRPAGFPAQLALGAGLGDLRIIPKGRLFTVGPFTTSITAAIEVPTGDPLNYVGNDGVTFEPRLILELDWNVFAVALNGSIRLRPDRSFTFATSPQTVTVDDEIFASAALRFGWREAFEFILDAHLVLALGEQDAEERAGEVLGGVRFHLPLGFIINLGAGPGIGRGVGTPTFRVLGGVHWMRKRSKEKVGDRDGDGILDPVDQCPDDPEDKDGFEDEDGCPDKDNDKDGILDTEDECPNVAEDEDGFDDDDGCPDTDNDHDGLTDADDKCPADPEDHDGFEDIDGCPDKDNDGDRILDLDDRCPNHPETVNGVDDEDGCPDVGKGPVKIQHGRITVPPVYFATNKDRILRRSFRVLGKVAELLRDNLWVKKVRVEGHTDNRGGDELNLDLSRRRAASVTQFLVNKGVDADRLTPQGFGETQPRAPNTTRRGRAKNRRVDFIITDPAKAGEAPASPGPGPAPEPPPAKTPEKPVDPQVEQEQP